MPFESPVDMNKSYSAYPHAHCSAFYVCPECDEREDQVREAKNEEISWDEVDYDDYTDEEKAILEAPKDMEPEYKSEYGGWIYTCPTCHKKWRATLTEILE
jgi:hypothetical protein